MSKKTLIFDFDGTIANSFNIFISVYNEIGKEYNLTQITPSQARSLRSMSAKEVIRTLRISLFTLPFYLWKGRALFRKKVDRVKPIAGIIPVLEKLAKKYHLGILTSNDKETVETFLERNSLQLFDFIHSERNIFGKHTALTSLMKMYSLDHDDIIYIGDEVRDIESCRKAGVPIASVSWGLNARNLLEKHNPDYLFDQPEELLSLK